MKAVVRRSGWALACALLTVFFQSFLRQPVALPLMVALGALAIASAWKPYSALVLVAGACPLATIIYTMGRGEAGNAVFAEGIVLAFLTGWTARRAITGTPLQVTAAIRSSALLLALLAAASGVTHWSGIRAEAPAEPLRNLLDWYVLRDYPLHPRGIEPIGAAVVFVSGMFLVLAAADLCAGAPERRALLLRAMVLGAAAAAAYNIRRIVEVAAGAERPFAAFVDHALRTRVNVHYGDKNAAGSYFALTILLAFGLAGRHRILALLTVPPVAGALWLTGSRTAYVAALVALIGLAIANLRRAASSATRIAAGVALVGVVAAGAALYKWYPEGRNFTASRALEIRIGLTRAGVQMAAEHPVFGVGLGRFYGLSDRYAGQTLAKFRFARENAHNNFVQVLAELGVPGLLAFLFLIGSALALSLRAERPRPLHVTALTGGIGAFLLTCLGGHPLVVRDTTYPFWLAVGLAAAPMRAVAAPSRRWTMAAIVLASLVVASVPWRAARAAREADLEHVSSGFSLWQHEPDGSRYRWMGGRAMFYVASSASAVRVPLRIRSVVPRAIEVTVLLDGREINRILLSADAQWRTLRFLIRKQHSGAIFTRVDLIAAEPGLPPLEATATRDSGIVMVGRPVIEP